ncbi:MAG: hypothetical protein IJD89_00480 [Clostridia bacterium]|nr:hypothetical protein [Clostridia bacterium]
MEYNVVKIFTKRTNLSDWFYANHDLSEARFSTNERYENLKRSYQKERDVRLILLVRYENDTLRTFCKIHCPINPLPVKGEFEVPNLGVICRYLVNNGWTMCDTIPANLLE